MDAVQASVQNPDERSELRDRRDTALSNCNEQIDFFQSAARRAHWLHGGSQIITIVISAAIPVLLLVDPEGLPQWLVVDMSTKTLAALLSALVAIASGMAGTFHWHEQWVRSAFFTQQLLSERAKFATRADVYGKARSEQQAIDRFVTRTEELRLMEAGQWRERTMERTKTVPSDTEQHPDSKSKVSP